MSQIPNRLIRKFLSDNKAIFKKEVGPKRLYILNNVLIAIPSEESIDLRHFIDLAEDQMGLSWWEIDYFLGENGIVA